MDVQQLIKEQVNKHPVVLYMKGTPQFPQCGFSALAVQVLNASGVRDFFSVNVLENPGSGPGLHTGGFCVKSHVCGSQFWPQVLSGSKEMVSMEKSKVVRGTAPSQLSFGQ